MVPGDKCGSDLLSEEPLSECRKIYVRGRRKVKGKTVADVVEALIGAYLSTGGEVLALFFMDWIGIKVDFMIVPYERHFQLQAEKFVNVRYLESLLNYSFRDPSLLVEALTHGSYMLPEIPSCYQVILSIIMITFMLFMKI
jgi:endoribonuclease Dicer